MSTIQLKTDTYVSTGYLGRGIPSKGKTLPAGSTVEYFTTERHRGQDYLPFVETLHEVRIKDGQYTFSAYRTTYALRHAFEPATYYRDAIERLPEGIWSTGTAGGFYVADDGFGNLVQIPDQSNARPNHFSSAKAVEDCVLGRHIWVPRG